MRRSLVDLARAAVTAVAALGLALGLAGCKPRKLDDITFTRAESLPGFDVTWPAGKPTRSATAPGAGEILMRKYRAVLAVTWQAGHVPAADLPVFGRATLTALGAATGGRDVAQHDLAVAAPDYGTELVVPTDKHVILIVSLIQCVHANVTLSVMTMASDQPAAAQRFHDRFRSTVRCRQDGPVQVTGSGLPTFAPGDDAAYLPGSDPSTFLGLTGARWYITPGTRSQRAAYENPAAVKGMFAGFGLTVTDQRRLPGRGTGDWLTLDVTVDLDGEPGHVLVGLLACPADVSYGVIYMNTVELGVPLDPAELDRVSCPAAPVDPASLPAATTRFTAACDAGAGLACALLADLADEEPTLVTGQDQAALRARACQLGVTAACR